MVITHHYRSYEIIEVSPERFLIKLPMRQYPLTNYQAETLKEAMIRVDDMIQDARDEYLSDLRDEAYDERHHGGEE